MKILFVGTDNKTRSVMAEMMFRKMVKESPFEGKVMCLSCGIAANKGEKMDENSEKVLGELDVEISDFKTRKLSESDIEMWDAFFVMTETHAYILEKAGISISKIYTPNINILDVSNEEIERYRECREQIMSELQKFFEKLSCVL